MPGINAGDWIADADLMVWKRESGGHDPGDRAGRSVADGYRDPDGCGRRPWHGLIDRALPQDHLEAAGAGEAAERRRCSEHVEEPAGDERG